MLVAIILGPVSLCMFTYVFCHDSWMKCCGSRDKDDYDKNDHYVEHEYDSNVLEMYQVNVVDNLMEDQESYKKYNILDSGGYEPPS